MNNKPGGLKTYITLLLGAFILMLFALYGNFPILTSDTGTYITSGFRCQVPADRPIFYGLFIRFTSLGVSVWLTIFSQCLILCYVLARFIQKLVPQVTDLQLLGFLLFISLFTIGGWFASQLMPDIFTAIMALAATSFLIFPNTRSEKIKLLAIILLSVLMHNSNFVVLTLFTILFTLFTFRKFKARKHFAKPLLLFFICMLSWLSFCTSNWLGGNGFTASRSTHVFVMGKLVESGVLKTYLDKACPIRDYKICAYIHNLPPVAWEFHWDAASPLQQTGGWEANREEYNTIIRDIFSRPRYYPYIMYKAVEATARQLVLWNIDDIYTLPWMKFDEDTSPFKAIQQYFPHELNQLKVSRLNTKTFNIAFYNSLFVVVLVLSCVAVLFSLPRSYRREFYLVVGCIGAFMLLNAFTTAILSSVNTRFNSRMIWLVPFINMIMLFKMISFYYAAKKVSPGKAV